MEESHDLEWRLMGSQTTCVEEVKCPKACRNKSFSECASGKVSNFCLMKECSPGLRLNTSHRYCHQVQVQLFVTKARFCDFVVWSPAELHLQRIPLSPSYLRNIFVLRYFCLSICCLTFSKIFAWTWILSYYLGAARRAQTTSCSWASYKIVSVQLMHEYICSMWDKFHDRWDWL